MSAQPEATFETVTKNLLREYVQSVLFIDDEWPDLTEIFEKEVPDESDLIPTTDIDDIDIEADNGKSQSRNKTTALEKIGTKNGVTISTSDNKDPRMDEKPKGLATKLSGDASLLEFERDATKKGILFSGLTYRKKEHHDTVIELASRADIIVLDWELASDNGREAISILKRLIGTGLRFICMFTQEEGLSQIKRHIIESLNEKLQEYNKINSEHSDPEHAMEFKIRNLVIALRKVKLSN